ncbi:MAG TPA: MoaD/ThiS family protein [Rhizomicrobium sp.]|jgi:molybdopterin converting factor small subunit
MVRLVFLGKLGDVAPAELAEIALPGGVRTLSDLREWLGRTVPHLGHVLAATPTRLVLNQVVAHDMSAAVRDGDEVAFMPPMSGG